MTLRDGIAITIKIPVIMNSKIDLRMEAVRIAAGLEDITHSNLISVAESIERYIIGNAALPEVMDMKEMMSAFTDLQELKRKDYGQEEGQELSLGIPKITE